MGRSVEDIGVKYVCERFSKGNIDLKNKEHVGTMLRAEGQKRVESFLFEKIFIDKIEDGLNPSTGWIFQYPDDEPDHWFRLVTEENPWGRGCDRELLDFLEGVGKEVVRVSPVEGGFTGQVKTKNGWSQEDRLRSILQSVTGWRRAKGSPRNYRHIDHSRNKAATHKILSSFTSSELENLGASRNLINCFLTPWYNLQPMDIDAAVETDDGLRFVEFKRKYPARKGTFGIDEDPHGMLIDWLYRHDMPLLHVLLVDPLWDKDESPLHLLRDESSTSPLACWLGLQFDPGTFVKGGGFQTYGSDSGMTGGQRSQREIERDQTVFLGEGLSGGRLNDFLYNPEGWEGENVVDYLKDLRDQARMIY